MQIVRTVSLAAVAAIQILQPATRSEPVLVTAVFDGDTVDVKGVGHVRLLGIDAPEIGHGLDTGAPYGREARERLADLVLRHWVRLEYEGPRTDMYGRKLAYVLLEDGTVVNAVLLREGLARISARAPLSRLDELRRAEADAMAFRRGMWQNAPSTTTETIESTKVAKLAKTKPKPAAAPKKAPKPKVYKVADKKEKKKKKKDGGVTPL